MEHFHPKTPEQLKQQRESIEQKIPELTSHYISKEDLDNTDQEYIQKTYKERYNIYLKFLREQKKNEGKKETDIYMSDLDRMKEWLQALNNLDTYIEDQKEGKHSVLRGRQIPVFNEIRKALEGGIKEGYIKLPTGTGKTVLFSQVIEAMGLKTLIGVPSLPLVKQTSDKMDRFTTKSYGVYTGKEKDLSKDITTITYLSLINTVNNKIITPNMFPLIILDEAHKSLGPETRKAVQTLEGIKLQFTATPRPGMEHEIYSMSLKEAIKEGLVCRTKTIHAHTAVDLSSVPIVNGDYDEKLLEKVINTKGRNTAALELYKSKFKGHKAIVNCSGIKHSQDVAQLFSEHGVRAAHIDGNMSDDQRDAILEQLNRGQIDIITNARLLLEGFDEQTLSVCLNLHPTLSSTDAEQRGGRALRIDDANPDKWGYVVDFIDQNSKKKPILFSEILEGAVVVPEIEEEDEKVQDKEILEEEIEDTLPIDFSEVPEGAVVVPEIEEEDEKTRDKKRIPRPIPPIDFSDLHIDGLRVVVDEKLVMEVTKEYQEARVVIEYPDKKEGWESASSLREVLKADSKRIKNIAEQYRETHPEWFETQKPSTGAASEYYSPELILKLKEKFKVQ